MFYKKRKFKLSRLIIQNLKCTVWQRVFELVPSCHRKCSNRLKIKSQNKPGSLIREGQCEFRDRVNPQKWRATAGIPKGTAWWPLLPSRNSFFLIVRLHMWTSRLFLSKNFPLFCWACWVTNLSRSTYEPNPSFLYCIDTV